MTATNAEGEGASSNEASATPAPASAPTTTTLSSSPNPSTPGQSVDLHGDGDLRRRRAGRRGHVHRRRDSVGLRRGVDGTGHAAFSTTALAAGSHILTATFSGTAGWGNSSGTNSGAPQVVNPVVTTDT